MKHYADIKNYFWITVNKMGKWKMLKVCYTKIQNDTQQDSNDVVTHV